MNSSVSKNMQGSVKHDMRNTQHDRTPTFYANELKINEGTEYQQKVIPIQSHTADRLEPEEVYVDTKERNEKVADN